MPTQYTIKFNNQSGGDNTYAFFVKAPTLSQTPGSYFSNFWISQFVPKNGTFDIQVTDQFYACDLPMFAENGTAVFGPDANNGQVPASYQITTNSSFGNGEGYLVGMGQVDNSGQIVPVATVAAQPSIGYEFTPIVKFFVAESESVQGTTVDVSLGSLNPGPIDFSTGQGLNAITAIVTVDTENNFTTKYR